MGAITDAPPSVSERRLAAIVFTDVVGYSARMQRDEVATMALVHADFERIRALCAQQGGELLNTMGDGLLLCFPSAVQAVACALQLQSEFGQRNAALPPEEALEHRIGVHLGDVFRQEAGGVAGDGVNIAARLQTRAPPGGICISQTVHDTVKGKVPMQEVFLGPESFKNIAEPILIYHISSPPKAGESAQLPPVPPVRPMRSSHVASAAVAVIAIAGIAGAGSWLWTQRAVTPTAASVDTKSIAVLPFANMSDDKENSLFFADGIHEDILTNLALIRDLRVVSRTSVMQYRATTKPIRQIGQELGVAYLLEGSVRRSGAKVRVTGQLINARTDEHVWAKNYDRDLTDIFAIQAALAQEIADSLKTALSPQEKSFIERRPTENTAAYDLFLQARDTGNRDTFGLAALSKQEGFLEKAVELDPNFAAAWGVLSVVHALHGFWGLDTSEARLAKARAASDKSVRLAPDSPDVIRALGTYYYYGYRNYTQAQTQYEKLARLQPNDPTVYSSLGLIQRRQGRWAESLVNLRKAAQLDPGNINFARSVSASLIAGRRFEEAMTEQRRLIALLPQNLAAAARQTLFVFYASGTTKEKDEWLARLPAAQFDSPWTLDFRKLWAEILGDFAEFRRLDRLQPYFDENMFGGDRSDQALTAATIFAANGDAAGARTRLENHPKMLRARLEREPANARVCAQLGMMEAILGHKQDALRFMQKAVALLPESRDALDGTALSENLAFVYAWTGDKDRAIAELARLLRLPGLPQINVHYLRRSARYTPLGGDPRFEALLNDPKNNAPLF